MAEHIDREAFLADRRKLYCEDCKRRKGMKNGKMRFIYEIGGPPCRSCGIGDVLDDVEDYPAADVVDGSTFRDCRNELCLRCGEYRLRYKGACDGCRWKEVEP